MIKIHRADQLFPSSSVVTIQQPSKGNEEKP